MTAPRKAVAAAVLAAVLFAAVVVQLTVVNRLPFPGGAVPDLVLLLVSAIAVATTPAVAAVTGFSAGLAVDVAPPAAHAAGEYALVFCLAAYAAARASRAISDRTGERDPVTAFTVMVAATVAAEAGKGALGLLLSDPDVTVAAVSRVLPGAVLYDLLLSPFAFWLVALVMSRAAAERRPRREHAPVRAFRRGQRPAAVRLASAGAVPGLRLAGTGASYQARPAARRVPRLRLAGSGVSYQVRPATGRAPRLRLAGSGASYQARPAAGRVPRLRLAGSGASYQARPAARRVPKLHLAGSRPGSAAATALAPARGPSSPLPAGRRRKLNFAGDLPVRAAARQARVPGRNWLKGAAPAPRRTRRPGGPSRGWLRGARTVPVPAARHSPPRGWLGRTHRPSTVIGKGVPGNRRLTGLQGAAGGDWNAASGPGARPRRGWRNRSGRLLRLMGVGH